MQCLRELCRRLWSQSAAGQLVAIKRILRSADIADIAQCSLQFHQQVSQFGLFHVAQLRDQVFIADIAKLGQHHGAERLLIGVQTQSCAGNAAAPLTLGLVRLQIGRRLKTEVGP